MKSWLTSSVENWESFSSRDDLGCTEHSSSMVALQEVVVVAGNGEETGDGVHFLSCLEIPNLKTQAI